MAAIKEFDGARSMDLAADSNFVYVEVGETVLSLDRQLFIHAMKRALGIAFIVEEVRAASVA